MQEVGKWVDLFFPTLQLFCSVLFDGGRTHLYLIPLVDRLQQLIMNCLPKIFVSTKLFLLPLPW